MNNLETLRPKVREAVRLFGAVIEELGLHDDYESALHVLCAELLEELMDVAVQTQCGCGHPACRQCARDKRWHETIERALGHNGQGNGPRDKL